MRFDIQSVRVYGIIRRFGSVNLWILAALSRPIRSLLVAFRRLYI